MLTKGQSYRGSGLLLVRLLVSGVREENNSFPDDQIKDLRLVLTVVDGQIVYADGDFAGLEG